MTDQLTDRPGPAEAEAAAGPVRVAWATVPKVNLLPLEIIEARSFRRVQALLATALIATVAVAAVGTVAASGAVSSADDDLAGVQHSVAGVQAQQARYAEVPKVTAQVDAAGAARTLALGNDVLWYRFLNDLEGALPSPVDLPNLTVSLNSATAAASSVDPLSPTGIGIFSASGVAHTYPQVSALLEGLDKVNGLRTATLTSASKEAALDEQGREVIDVTVGAVLGPDALSGRYDKKDD